MAMSEDYLKVMRDGAEGQMSREVMQARHLVAQAGDIAAPPGQQCVGFGVVFYYKPKNAFSREDLTIAAHSYVRHISERFAGAGWQALRKQMMGHFGRRAPGIKVEEPKE
jgi:hypothetical protein